VLPEIDVARLSRWVEDRNTGLPEPVRSQIRYELDLTDRSATLLECRPPWDGVGEVWTRFPIARLRYTSSRKEWSLYWRDSNLKFHLYDLVPPTPTVADLLDEVDRDPTALFWG
jgi:hypothetical protein